jgi:hypothetical protein
VKTLKIAGRIIRTDRIDQLRICGETASVWLIGRPEPITTEDPAEVSLVVRYATLAMSEDAQ